MLAYISQFFFGNMFENGWIKISVNSYRRFSREYFFNISCILVSSAEPVFKKTIKGSIL